MGKKSAKKNKTKIKSSKKSASKSKITIKAKKSRAKTKNLKKVESAKPAKVKKPAVPKTAKLTKKTEIKETPPAGFSKKDKEELTGLLSDAYARQTLINLAGENTLDIIRIFPVMTSDEEISKKLKVKISDIRSALNKLHGNSLVTYQRKKDNETGWYSYSWSLNKGKIIEWVTARKKEREELFNETREHYFCPKCGIDSIMPFENASDYQFRCPFCNGSLNFLEKENAEKIFHNYLPSEIRKRGHL
ncbi:hypothetical protein JXB01_02630 [Candidatus Micrarchaeota archaeon]|nr:hypothetical protein [Candidatus Micrarchaeota archaeon]